MKPSFQSWEHHQVVGTWPTNISACGSFSVCRPERSHSTVRAGTFLHSVRLSSNPLRACMFLLVLYVCLWTPTIKRASPSLTQPLIPNRAFTGWLWSIVQVLLQRFFKSSVMPNTLIGIFFITYYNFWHAERGFFYLSEVSKKNISSSPKISSNAQSLVMTIKVFPCWDIIAFFLLFSISLSQNLSISQLQFHLQVKVSPNSQRITQPA